MGHAAQKVLLSCSTGNFWGSHERCQVLFRTSGQKLGLPLRRHSGQEAHLAGESGLVSKGSQGLRSPLESDGYCVGILWRRGYPLQAPVHGVAKSPTRLSDFTFTFHFHALEKEIETHSSILAWQIPWTGLPGGLQSMGSQKESVMT